MEINPKRKYKIVPSKSIFSDVDDTLIKWAEPGCNFKDHPEAIKLDMFGSPIWVLPMWENINALKKFYESGYEVVVWSLSSKQWAEEVVKVLGIEQWVDYCVSKPDFFLDDREITHFMLPEKRIYYPYKP
jgi:hydroxymethylpyrimidine pyrophosphatase-like HAD family hydrolase